jgi:hypothetical protein
MDSPWPIDDNKVPPLALGEDKILLSQCRSKPTATIRSIEAIADDFADSMDIDIEALRLGILATRWRISDHARPVVPDTRQAQLNFERAADVFEVQLEERKRPRFERSFVDARKRQMQMFMAGAPVNVNGDRSGLPGKS